MSASILPESLARFAPVGLGRTDARGQCIDVNDEWCRITGLAREEALGVGWTAVIHPDDRERVLKSWGLATDGRRGFEGEFRVRRPDGETRWVVGRARPELLPGGEVGGWVTAITDVTEHKRREQRLGERLLEAQESERRALARELHDHIGQELTALKMVLQLALRDSGTGKQDLEDASALVDELVWRVRGLSLDLRPSLLDDLGLQAALELYFERFTARTSIRARFEHGGLQARLAPRLETAAYRIVQEALTNVARHARVAHASVRIVASARMLIVQVEDRGTGFDVEGALAGGASSGLSGMRERAELLGGQLTVESNADIGTVVTAWLPVGDGGRAG